MNNTTFVIKEKPLDQNEVERLKGAQFGSGMPGSAEIVDAVKWFFAMVAAAVFCFFFGGWVIKKFVGPGVLIFGYGARFIAAPALILVAISNILKLLRPAHKKKASDALKWMWLVSIMGEDAVSERFGKLEYAKSTMRRMLPEGCGYNSDFFGGYVTKLRDAMNAVSDVEGEKLKAQGWNQSTPNKSITILEEKDVAPGVKELHAELKYQDLYYKQEGNKNVNSAGALITLDITQSFICSGKYWFPYDDTPEWEQKTE